MAFAPWTAHPVTAPAGSPMQHHTKALYVVGMWGKDLSYRIRQAPAWVRSQQVAELHGLQAAIKLGAYRGHPDVEIVGANLGTLQQVVHQRARAALRHQ